MRTTSNDASGTIEKHELGNTMRQIAMDVGDENPSEQDIDEVFIEFDKDKRKNKLQRIQGYHYSSTQKYIKF